MIGYFDFPGDSVGGLWRTEYYPSLAGARLTNGRDTTLGVVTQAHIYSTGFHRRMVVLRMRATDGTEYYGRASWDNGTCVVLRRAKAR